MKISESGLSNQLEREHGSRRFPSRDDDGRRRGRDDGPRSARDDPTATRLAWVGLDRVSVPERPAEIEPCPSPHGMLASIDTEVLSLDSTVESESDSDSDSDVNVDAGSKP